MAGTCQRLATLPWFELSKNPDLKLENSAMFNNAKFDTDAERKRQIAVFKSLNQLFPFYIPLSVHGMFAEDIVKEYPNGGYWAVAIHYLISTIGLESFGWKACQEHLNQNSKCLTAENPKCPELEILESLLSTFAPEEEPWRNPNPRNFLMNTFVLTQLPFNAALCHQWLVAYLSEMSSVFMETSELRYLPMSDENEKLVGPIIVLVNSAATFVSSCLAFLQACVDTTDQSAKIVFPDMSVVVHVLSLHIENDFLKVIKSLKKLVWADSQSIGTIKKEKLLRRSNIYNLNFWRDATPNRKIFSDWCELDETEGEIDENVDLDDLLESLQPHCNHELKFSDKMKTILKKDKIFMKALLDLRRDEDDFLRMNSRKEEHGVINSVMSVLLCSYMTDSANRAKGRLCQLTRIHPRKLLKFNFDSLPDEQLAKNFLRNKEWTYIQAEHYLYDLSVTLYELFLNQNSWKLTRECPKHDEEPRIIASKFQARIKAIVFEKITLSHKKMVENNGDYAAARKPMYNSWQFQQLILPCFVASFLETFLSKDKPVPEATKVLYIYMIHNIISFFEMHSDNDIELEDYEDQFIDLYVLKTYSSPVLFQYSCTSTIREFSHRLRTWGMPFWIHFDQSLRLGSLLDALMKVMKLDSPIHKLTPVNRYLELLSYDFLWNFHLAINTTRGNVVGRFSSELFEIMNYLIIVLCHIGFHPNKFIDVSAHPELPMEKNLLLNLIVYCLRNQGSKGDITHPRRLNNTLRKRNRLPSNLLEGAKEEIRHLSATQTQCLAFYLTMKLVSKKNFAPMKTLRTQKPLSSLSIVFNSFVKGGRMWIFKQAVKLAIPDEDKVTLDFAKDTAPILHYVAINELNISSQSDRDTIDRNDFWFFPIKRCRYCGDTDRELDHICDFCNFDSCTTQPYGLFADTHYFCSEECNSAAMKRFHAKEHEEFLDFKRSSFHRNDSKECQKTCNHN